MAATPSPIRTSSFSIHDVPIDTGPLTFKGGLDAFVHRWFRLTPSFGPHLVAHMMEELGTTGDDIVLDPFAGAATTLIECQLRDITSYGLEINPFLHWAGGVTLDWSIPGDAVEEGIKFIEARFAAAADAYEPSEIGVSELNVPPIHNPYRWWRADVLRDLLVLKSLIDSQPYPVAGFLRLALAGVLVPHLTNVTLGRLQLHFIDRSDHHIDVLQTFTGHARVMLGDLRDVQSRGLASTARLLAADAKHLSRDQFEEEPSVVVTSPPYVNRYSYVWNTRPHLYFFDFFTTPRQAGTLDVATIGGTWGTATSRLIKGTVDAASPAVRTVTRDVVDAIRVSDNLMANYAQQYFNDLAYHLLSLDAVGAGNMRVAYVIGCSRLKGIFVESDVILARLIDQLDINLTVTKVHRIRRRNSGRDLHESIVYASRGLGA